jgi:hypothetical protein
VRLTYANVTSTLALFIALGGGAAIAANALVDSSKDIKAKVIANSDLKKETLKSNRLKDGRAVSGADVVPDSLGGAAINEGELAQVPSAANAASAASATDAAALGGLGVEQFARSSQIQAGGPINSNLTTETPIVSFPGLGLEVRTDGDNDVALQVRLVNSDPPGGRTYIAISDNGNTASTISPGANVQLQPGGLITGGYVQIMSAAPPTVAILLSCTTNGFDAVNGPVTCLAIRSA